MQRGKALKPSRPGGLESTIPGRVGVLELGKKGHCGGSGRRLRVLPLEPEDGPVARRLIQQVESLESRLHFVAARRHRKQAGPFQQRLRAALSDGQRERVEALQRSRQRRLDRRIT